jgi:hypothetical protein
VSADRVEALERRVVAREQMLEAMLIIEDARRRGRARATGTHLRAVADEAQ